MKAGFTKILLCVALGFAHRFAVADETCVPKAGGGWNCGKDVTASDGVPLPRPERTSRPPLLLIDPRRFGENISERVDAKRANVDQTASEGRAEPAAVVPEVKSTPSVQESQVRKGDIVTIPAVTAEPGTRVATLADARSDSDAVVGIGFTVQLAIASSTTGFDKLRSELKLSRSSTRELPLKSGSFALLMGVFPTIEAARAAIPSAAKGAFARDIRALESL